MSAALAPVAHAAHAAKVAVARALSHRGVGAAVARVFHDRIPNRGLTFDTSSGEIHPRVKAMLLFGLYERAEIEFIGRHLRGDLDVVELGSSLGVTGAHVLRKLEPGRRLVTVEANPALLAVVEGTLADHAGGRTWTLEHAAVAYEDAEVVSLAVHAATQRSRVGATSGHRGPAPNRVVEVPAVTLSQLLECHGIERFALVCDIEGAEAGIIEHDATALARCQRAIIELHDVPPLRIADLRQRLTDGHGFSVIDEHGPVLALART